MVVCKIFSAKVINKTNSLTFTTLITLYLKNENHKPVLRYELHTQTEVRDKEGTG